MKPKDTATLNYASPGLRPLSGWARTSFIGSLLTPIWIVAFIGWRIKIDPSGGDLPYWAEYSFWIVFLGLMLSPTGCGIYALIAIRRSRSGLHGRAFAITGVAASLGTLLLFLFLGDWA